MRGSAPSLRAQALRYLSQREHSRLELERKLKRYLQRQLRCQPQGEPQRELQRDLEREPQPQWPPAAAPEGHASGESFLHLAPGDADDPGDRPALAGEPLGTLLDSLSEEGWLSDSRAAESLLRSQSVRSGHLRLQQQLQAKGLGSDLVAESLGRLRGTESERALLLWQRKFGDAPADAKAYARQARFLARRGFDGDTIRRVLQQRSS